MCSILFDKRILNLGYENKSGIIIRENFLKGLSGKHAWDCLFTVRGGSAGVIAVIQQMKFRTNRTEGHNASCIDFVQVKKIKILSILTSISFDGTVSYLPSKWSNILLPKWDQLSICKLQSYFFSCVASRCGWFQRKLVGMLNSMGFCRVKFSGSLFGCKTVDLKGTVVG